MRQLIASIERYVEQNNVRKRPFVWAATAGSIIQKVARYFWDGTPGIRLAKYRIAG